MGERKNDPQSSSIASADQGIEKGKLFDRNGHLGAGARGARSERERRQHRQKPDEEEGCEERPRHDTERFNKVKGDLSLVSSTSTLDKVEE